MQDTDVAPNGMDAAMSTVFDLFFREDPTAAETTTRTATTRESASLGIDDDSELGLSLDALLAHEFGADDAVEMDLSLEALADDAPAPFVNRDAMESLQSALSDACVATPVTRTAARRPAAAREREKEKEREGDAPTPTTARKKRGRPPKNVLCAPAATLTSRQSALRQQGLQSSAASISTTAAALSLSLPPPPPLQSSLDGAESDAERTPTQSSSSSSLLRRKRAKADPSACSSSSPVSLSLSRRVAKRGRQQVDPQREMLVLRSESDARALLDVRGEAEWDALLRVLRGEENGSDSESAALAVSVSHNPPQSLSHTQAHTHRDTQREDEVHTPAVRLCLSLDAAVRRARRLGEVAASLSPSLSMSSSRRERDPLTGRYRAVRATETETDKERDTERRAGKEETEREGVREMALRGYGRGAGWTAERESAAYAQYDCDSEDERCVRRAQREMLGRSPSPSPSVSSSLSLSHTHTHSANESERDTVEGERHTEREREIHKEQDTERDREREGDREAAVRAVASQRSLEVLVERLERETELAKCFSRARRALSLQRARVAESLSSCARLVRGVSAFCEDEEARSQRALSTSAGEDQDAEREGETERDSYRERETVTERDTQSQAERHTQDPHSTSQLSHTSPTPGWAALRACLSAEQTLTEAALRSKAAQEKEDDRERERDREKDKEREREGAPGDELALVCRYEDLARTSEEELRQLVPENRALCVMRNALRAHLLGSAAASPSPSLSVSPSLSSSSVTQSIYYNAAVAERERERERETSPDDAQRERDINAYCAAVYPHWVARRARSRQSLLRAAHVFVMGNWTRGAVSLSPSLSSSAAAATAAERERDCERDRETQSESDNSLPFSRDDFPAEALVHAHGVLLRVRRDLDRYRLIVDRVRRREKVKKDLTRLACDRVERELGAHTRIDAQLRADREWRRRVDCGGNSGERETKRESLTARPLNALSQQPPQSPQPTTIDLTSYMATHGLGGDLAHIEGLVNTLQPMGLSAQVQVVAGAPPVLLMKRKRGRPRRDQALLMQQLLSHTQALPLPLPLLSSHTALSHNATEATQSAVETTTDGSVSQSALTQEPSPAEESPAPQREPSLSHTHSHGAPSDAEVSPRRDKSGKFLKSLSPPQGPAPPSHSLSHTHMPTHMLSLSHSLSQGALSLPLTSSGAEPLSVCLSLAPRLARSASLGDAASFSARHAETEREGERERPRAASVSVVGVSVSERERESAQRGPHSAAAALRERDRDGGAIVFSLLDENDDALYEHAERERERALAAAAARESERENKKESGKTRKLRAANNKAPRERESKAARKTLLRETPREREREREREMEREAPLESLERSFFFFDRSDSMDVDPSLSPRGACSPGAFPGDALDDARSTDSLIDDSDVLQIVRMLADDDENENEQEESERARRREKEKERVCPQENEFFALSAGRAPSPPPPPPPNMRQESALDAQYARAGLPSEGLNSLFGSAVCAAPSLFSASTTTTTATLSPRAERSDFSTRDTALRE